MKLNAPPNTPVFTLQAKDPDSDPNLHYFLVRDRSKIFVVVNIFFKYLSKRLLKELKKELHIGLTLFEHIYI